jgi:hypothetical protein
MTADEAIAITLKIPGHTSGEANEKRKVVQTPSMRRPVGVKKFFHVFCTHTLCRVATVAILPSAVVDEQFARCKLGVLVSAGAAT